MTRINEIAQTLYQIESKITQLPVFVEGKGVTVEDPAYWERIDELDRLQKQLTVLIGDLTDLQRQADLRRKAEVFALSLEARKVRKLLEDLAQRNGMVDFDEAMKTLIEEGFKSYDQLGHTKQEQLVSPSPGPQVSAAEFDASPEKALLGVVLTVHAFISYWRKRKKK